MRIALASDHAGYELKTILVDYLIDEGHDVDDMGPFSLELEDDYPDYCIPVAKKVAEDSTVLGIVIGFSGQGEAIACNRVKGARAAVYYGGPEEVLRLSREHNDANVLSLGAKFLSVDEAKEAVSIWLATDFSHGERHQRRIGKLDN
jgi:ribose 5-phosphate isomerase B